MKDYCLIGNKNKKLMLNQSVFCRVHILNGIMSLAAYQISIKENKLYRHFERTFYPRKNDLCLKLFNLGKNDSSYSEKSWVLLHIKESKLFLCDDEYLKDL